MSDFPEATAEVSTTGDFPEDGSIIMNFEQISEGQKLYSREKVESHARQKFSIATKKGKESARIGLVTLIKNQEITEIEEVVEWCCAKLETFEAEEILEEINNSEKFLCEECGQELNKEAYNLEWAVICPMCGCCADCGKPMKEHQAERCV